MKRIGTYEIGIFFLVIIAVAHQYLQKGLSIHLPFLHSYLDDVLCIPIFLAIWRWERQQRWALSELTGMEIGAFVLFVFLLFEGVLPRYTTNFTADGWDGIAYAVGGIIFYHLQKSRNTDSFTLWTKKPSN